MKFLFILFLAPSLVLAFATEKNKEIRIGIGAEPQSIDPAISNEASGNTIIHQLFEGLVTLDSIDLSIRPGVAEKWTISDEGRKITFKLNSEAKWSNGKKVSALDFVWSWKRILNKKTGSRHASHLFHIVGAEELYNGTLKPNTKFGIEAKDERTLVVTLKSATPFFMTLAASKYLLPVPSETVQKFGEKKWLLPKNIVSNGPYILKEKVLNKHIIATKNPHYWDRKKVAIEKIVFKPIEDVAVEEKYFRTGKLHITNSIPIINAKKFIAEKKPEVVITPFLATSYLSINTDEKPLNDQRIRKALSLAIDRTLIVEKVTGTGQKPAQNFVPQNTVGYFGPKILNKTVTNENIKTAKKLLSEAGYPNGKGFPKVEVLYNTHEDVKTFLVAIQQMWKKNLNISVSLHNQEWRVFLDNFKQKNYQIARGAWSANYPDPLAFLTMFYSNDVNNRVGWKNKKYDKELKKTEIELDFDKRNQYFSNAEKILMDELPIIPIYHFTRLKQVSTSVRVNTGSKTVPFQSNVLDYLFVKNLELH